MFGGLNWELKGRPGVLEAGLKLAGLNWFVCMNCCWETVVEAGPAWRGPAGPNWAGGPLLGVTALLGCREEMEVRVSGPGPGDTN